MIYSGCSARLLVADHVLSTFDPAAISLVQPLASATQRAVPSSGSLKQSPVRLPAAGESETPQHAGPIPKAKAQVESQKLSRAGDPSRPRPGPNRNFGHMVGCASSLRLVVQYSFWRPRQRFQLCMKQHRRSWRGRTKIVRATCAARTGANGAEQQKKNQENDLGRMRLWP